MPNPHDPLSARLVAASLEFHRLRLWLELEQDSAFLIRLPDEPEPIVAMVMGQGGEHFGLSLYRGIGAIESARRLVLGDYDEAPPVAEGTVQLSVSFERLEVIPVERRTILVDAGFTTRREALAPAYFALLPSGRARLPNRSEMRVLTLALNAVIKARAEGPLESGQIESDAELFTLRMVEHADRPATILREREALPPLSAELRALAASGALEHAASEEAEEAEPDEPPVPEQEPMTLSEWKAVETSVWSRLEAMARTDGENRDRALVFFFGDAERGKAEMRRWPHHALGAFVEWYSASWRDPHDSTTRIERWLERATSPSIRRLLDSRRRATPRFFRVASTDPATMRVVLEDVATGHRATVLDQSFAASGKIGIIVAARLLETDVGTFCTLASSPISPHEFHEVVDFLEREGLAKNLRGLDDKPELLGRVFLRPTESAESRAAQRRLENTDGDPLSVQSATFSFDDRAAVIATLRAHKEIEEDEAIDETKGEKSGTDSFVWLRTTAKGKKALGGPTVYGRITVGASELSFEVNSDRRLKLARKMLESIRGVRFVRTEVIPTDLESLKSRSREAPPSEPLPPDPARIEALRAFLHEREMKWLDTKVPTLGNRTPRQVARTKEGREQIAMMIRTRPAVGAPGGISIEPPRAEMLRALGIDDRTADG